MDALDGVGEHAGHGDDGDLLAALGVGDGVGEDNLREGAVRHVR